MNAERPNGPATTPSSAYDFDRLEHCVEHLLHEHERLSAEREELLSELVEREQRIAALEARLAEEGTRRKTAVGRVDRILEQLSGLESEVAAASRTAE